MTQSYINICNAKVKKAEVKKTPVLQNTGDLRSYKLRHRSQELLSDMQFFSNSGGQVRYAIYPPS